MKELAGRPAKSVDGDVTGDDHGDGIKNRTVHVFRCGEDHFVQVVCLAFTLAELAENVFCHYKRAIDDDPEIDGADGEQIRSDIMRVQKNKGEEQRQRNRHRHNEGCAETDEEENQHDQDEHHAAKQVCFYSVGGEPHEVAAVVKRAHLDIGGQDALVAFFGCCLYTLEHGLRLFAAAHEDHAFDGVIGFVETEFAEARCMADGDLANIAHPHGHAILIANDDASDVRLVTNQSE